MRAASLRKSPARRSSTAFDDEVIDFFAPHADGLDYMFVTVFGKRRPRTS